MEMLVIDKARIRESRDGRLQRRVFCVTENAHRSSLIADDAVRGAFTNAGVTIALGHEVDWLSDPYQGDEEWRIEWSKFYFGLDLAYAYSQSREPRYPGAWKSLVRSFISQVPVGLDSTDVAARRVQNWIYCWTRFARSPFFNGFDGKFESDLIENIRSQIIYIKENLTAERNHRTLELYAIFIATLALPELSSETDLLQFSINELHRNLLTDIQADGVQREQSTDYHMIVLRTFLGTLENARIFGVSLPESFYKHVVKACEFAMHVHRPDGFIPALSDSDTGCYLDLLKLAGKLFSRPDFAYVASGGRSGRPPKELGADFRKSGYYTQRSGWGKGQTRFEDERFLIFDCGHIGDGGHGHYDLLNIEIAANGMPLIADTGRYTYSEEGVTNWRQYFKGTRAHNTVCVDRKDQTEYRAGKPKRNIAVGRFLERVRLGALDVLCGKVVSPRYEASHTRRIFFINNEYWLIWDQLGSDCLHRYDLRFHLSPAAWNHLAAENNGRNKIVRFPGAVLAFEAETCTVVESGWYSPSYGIKHRIPVVRAFEENVSDAAFFTLVIPTTASTIDPEFQVSRNGCETTVEILHGSADGISNDLLGWSLAGEKLSRLSFESREVELW